jgi:hypothetical protein
VPADLARASARVLASAVCPNEETTRIGRAVFRASSVARLVFTPVHTLLKPTDHFEPRVRISGRRMVKAALNTFCISRQ